MIKIQDDINHYKEYCYDNGVELEIHMKHMQEDGYITIMSLNRGEEDLKEFNIFEEHNLPGFYYVKYLKEYTVNLDQ